MKALFFFLVTFSLIILQTVIFPSLGIFTQCFDLLIIDILFLSLISTHHSMIIAIVCIGLIMDSISGAPFFHYIFSYLWIYIIVHLVKQLFFKQSLFFIVIISGVSILIQQGFLLFSVFIKQDAHNIAALNLMPGAYQLFWGLIFIPLGVFMLKVCLRVWEDLSEQIQKKISKNIEWYID